MSINEIREQIRKLEQKERTHEDTTKLLDLYGELADQYLFSTSSKG